MSKEIELKRRPPDESREYLMIQIAELLLERRELADSLAEMVKYYMHPNPPHDMLSRAKEALSRTAK